MMKKEVLHNEHEIYWDFLGSWIVVDASLSPSKAAEYQEPLLEDR